MTTITSPELYTPSELNAQASSNLVADPLLLTTPIETVIVDQQKGGLVRLADLFITVDPSATFTVKDANNLTVAYAQLEDLTQGIRISPAIGTPNNFSLVVTQTTTAGVTSSRAVDISLTSLSFTPRPLPSSRFSTVAVGDLNGDGRKDLAGYLQNPDGSLSATDPNSIGLGKLFANGRVHRDNRLVDLDNDGDLDLIATTYVASTPGVNIAYVFSNDGTGKFTEVPSFSNLNVQGYGETIVTADFNNDGLNDFYLPYYFRNGDYGSRLFINQGNLQFSEQTAAWKITNSSTGSLSLKGFGLPWEPIMPEGAQAVDFNKDGLIDLYVGSHLFINKGNSFFDATQSLGLPVIFEEGAKFFDWNNDGYLDFVILPPNKGPQLYQYNANTSRFELKDVFPSRNYVEAFGLSVGDLNGDGWEDIYTSGGTVNTPRIYLNQQGKKFTEYRSQSTEKLGKYAGPVIDDINGDGKNDLLIGATGGILDNIDTLATYTVAITLTGSKGEKNQYGRIVELRPTNTSDTRVLTRVVDGGSGYMAQKDYALTFTDAQATTYQASCYLIDYPSGAPVLVSFTVQSGKQYTVKSASGSQPIEVRDTTTNTTVAYTRNGGQSTQDDIINLTTPQAVNLSTGVGNDSITLNNPLQNSWAGSKVAGGDGSDTIVFNGSNAYTPAQIKLFGDAGDDIIQASTAVGQLTGAIRIEGGTGNDRIEVGHIEGSQSIDSGIDGGGGNDSILVIDTLGGVGIFGNSRFDIFGGAGNDRIELRGIQFNLLGASGPVIDGGSGLDTFVWNARYDLNQNTNQTGVDAANPSFAQEIGVRNVEILDVAASGALAKNIALSLDDVRQITAGSDFDRINLTGLGLTGIGKTLALKLGDVSNQLKLSGWNKIGNTSLAGTTYATYQQSDSLLLVTGGTVNANTTTNALSWLGTANKDVYTSTADVTNFLAQGLAGDDAITLVGSSINSRAGSTIEGGNGNDTLTFNGINAYTAAQIKIFGGTGNDVIRASTAAGQYTGAIRIEGGTGNDQIEVGHIEGSRSSNSGIDGGDGDDSILVLNTLADVGIFGNARFDILGGAGNDRIELRGRQFNLLGVSSPVVDGGSGLDTLVWNARYDLNQNTNQTGVDAANPSFAQEIGVRNVEVLDVAASGATGKSIVLNIDAVHQITAGSNFNRANLAGLKLTGIGNTLLVNMGSATNNLTIDGGWTNLGNTSFGGITYNAYQLSDSLLLVNGSVTPRL